MQQKLLDIIKRPAAYGIHVPDGYSKLLPTSVYACDETVLHYSPAWIPLGYVLTVCSGNLARHEVSLLVMSTAQVLCTVYTLP